MQRDQEERIWLQKKITSLTVFELTVIMMHCEKKYMKMQVQHRLFSPSLINREKYSGGGVKVRMKVNTQS